jgi:lipoprotein-anchoring transpeptidase ErfK/SrfK
VTTTAQTRRPRPFAFCRAALAAVATLAFVLAGGLAPATASEWAPPRTVFVPETGHTSDGLFLRVWREQRSLFGDPVTEEIPARAGFEANPERPPILQYYQHLALVYVPDAAPDEQVQTLPLGRDALEEALTRHPSRALLAATRRTACPPGITADCLGFAAAGHTTRGAFRDAWLADETGRWLGPPLTEAFRAPDGSLLQYFEAGALRQPAGGHVAPLPLGLLAARRLGLDTAPITRPVDVPVFDEALFVAPVVAPSREAREGDTSPAETAEGADEGAAPDPEPAAEPAAPTWEDFGPGPVQGGEREIVVSLSAQRLWAYDAGELVLATWVSTGTAETPEVTTPVGHWRILHKVDVEDMEGTISDEYYFVEDVPHVMYFDDLGNALHGTYWHSNFGAPMSHGCVNLPLDVAAWMYDWAPVGTPVTVVP